MKRNSGLKKIALMTGVTAMIATPVLAEKANRLTDINGMFASDAETELRSRGFEYVSTHNSSGFTYSYWWDEGIDDCVIVEARDGQVLTINDATDQDCGHHKGDDAAAAIGVAAGAAILGGLLSHKSHHREGKEYDETQTAEVERGYRDGLHNASYHNYNRDDAYSHGYSKGVEERDANLRHHNSRHHGRGGYTPVAQFADLKNARAAGGMDTLQQRGFRQVDNFTSGNTRYSIQWQPNTRQCVQVTIADGRFYDLSDIGQHPKCR